MNTSGSRCERHGFHAARPRAVRVGATQYANTNPPMSSAQFAAFQSDMGNIPEPLGGFAGCAYEGVPFGLDGVVCQNGMPEYHARDSSYAGKWVSNVDMQFPSANISSPGGLDQILLGGGAGDVTNNPCLEACSCLNDVNCACRNTGDSPGHNCGWSSVNNTCMSPSLGGQYKSLSACERANHSGRSGAVRAHAARVKAQKKSQKKAQKAQKAFVKAQTALAASLSH
jgi:hypothetical protein